MGELGNGKGGKADGADDGGGIGVWCLELEIGAVEEEEEEAEDMEMLRGIGVG